MIVEAAHSVTLSSIYTAIANLLRESHSERRHRITSLPGIDAFLIDHHGKILDSVRSRDGDEAVRLLADHFEIGAELRRAAPGTARDRARSALSR